MSASNQYKSTQSSCCNNSSYEDEENYVSSSKCLKYEDDQIYVTEDNSDSFSEKRGFASNQFSLQNHEKAYQIQQQKLNAIKNLIDPCEEQQYQQFGNNINESHPLTSFIHSQLQNNENNYQSQISQKSKKEILKEKREKKKMQIQEKKQSFQNQEDQAEQKKEYSKEEKAERQKIKNRESAQLSRDRKKLLENQMQQDLQFLTEENKQLQSMIKSYYTCQQCGFFNNPSGNSSTDTKQYANCKSNHIQLNSDSIQQRYQLNTQNIDTQNQQGADTNSGAPGPVYQFFDFSRTNAPIMTASPINLCSFGKGAWSTAFIIFIIYMMLVFSGPQQDGNGTLGSNFRMLKFIGPNAQIFEQYKNLSQEELLEELLKQIQLLKEQEKDEQLKQLKLIQMLANAAVTLNHTPETEDPNSAPGLNESQKTNLEESEKDFIIEESQSQNSSSSTATNSALLEKIQALEKEVTADSQPIQQTFLDFCQKYKEIQSNNEEERSYYKDLSKKLDELQREKLMQLESLKSIYCVSTSDAPFQENNQATNSQKTVYENQMYNQKMQFQAPFYSEKQLNNNYLNPTVLQEQSLEKLRSTASEQQTNRRQNLYNNSPPTFDNISQFFNDTASFREEDNNSSMGSSQSLDAVNERQEQQFIQEQQQYQSYRSTVRQNNMQQQYYNNQNIEQFEQNHENIHMIGEEEDPFNVIPQINTKKPTINYYELMQKKSADINNQQNQPQQQQQQQYQQYNQPSQAYTTQQISCQYSFQQNNFSDDLQNSNSTNSINLQSVQNGKVQQFNLLFSPYQNQGSAINNNKDDAQLLHNDVEKYIKFQCKFVDNNCIVKDNF